MNSVVAYPVHLCKGMGGGGGTRGNREVRGGIEVTGAPGGRWKGEKGDPRWGETWRSRDFLQHCLIF